MSNEHSMTTLASWHTLHAHARKMKETGIADLFHQKPGRFRSYNIAANGILIDYSKQAVDDDAMSMLFDLARTRGVEKQRDAMAAGQPVNKTEDRPALHMALRGSTPPALNIDEENVTQFVGQTLARIQTLSEKIRSNRTISDVAMIGIGGSLIGPRLVCEALKSDQPSPRIHYLANSDGRSVEALIDSLAAQSTIVLIASKTFGTSEVIENAAILKKWMESIIGEDASARFYAMTAEAEKAKSFGIPEHHILPMRRWISGRYSLWSAIGLAIAIAHGYPYFAELLKGARGMDTHFMTEAPEENMPIILGLLNIWNRNFMERAARAVIPYGDALRSLPVYVQQLCMESNGKSVSTEGDALSFQTSPVIFGEPGTQCQHAFFQMLHQGSDVVPVDFILYAQADHGLPRHQQKLIANALAQSKALMDGSQNTENPHKNFAGNRPSTTIVLDRLNAFHLGGLLALIEHTVFVESALWGINAFDQWGVELGKTLAVDIANALGSASRAAELSSDDSTRGLIDHIRSRLS